MKMKVLALFLCAASVGCNYRIHIQKRAEWAAPEEAEKVEFPASTEGSMFLDGPTLKAIEVASNEFLPPGASASSYDERIARCLSLRENYDVSVQRVGVELYFVTFSANLARCGLDEVLFDAGATYAVDGQGRILATR